MKFDWIDILIGVVCIVIAGLLVGWLLPMLNLALPGFVYTAIAAFLGILLWFTIRGRIIGLNLIHQIGDFEFLAHSRATLLPSQRFDAPALHSKSLRPLSLHDGFQEFH